MKIATLDNDQQNLCREEIIIKYHKFAYYQEMTDAIKIVNGMTTGLL